MKITGLDEERHGRRWNGQRALVTGAGQGIGQAVAQLLASKGVKVAVNDIVPERAENTVKLIADAGGEAFAAIGDIADPTVVEDLFRQLDERFGGIDILVNVAGIIIKDSLDDTDLERWNRILAVNLTADFLTIKQAVKRMRKQHYGRIVKCLPSPRNMAAATWAASPTRPPRRASRRSREERPGSTRRTAST